MNTLESMKLDRAAMDQRALRCWGLMTHAEQTGVRLGLLPHWSVKEDLGGKAPPGTLITDCWEELTGRFTKEFALALFRLAEKTGGMIA